MATIYVITADAEYETRTPICAFSEREDADIFLQRIRVHDESYEPPPHDTGDKDADQAAYEKWERRLKRLAKKHPAGETWASYRTDFSITEVELA